MNKKITEVSAGAALLIAAMIAWPHGAISQVHGQAKDRGRIVRSESLPKMDGAHLKASLVKVRYGPGEASLPHTHPCPVLAYVVEGAVRTRVKGEREMIYTAGQSFYEPPDAVHLVSANASSTKTAKFVAYFLCDHEAPLSESVAQSREGESK